MTRTDVLPYARWIGTLAAFSLVLGVSLSGIGSLILNEVTEASAKVQPAPLLRKSVPPTPVLFATKAAEPERLGRAVAAPEPAEIVPPPKPQMLAVISLAVRAQPAKSATQVTAIQDGEIVTVSGKQGGWILVTTPDGKTGWAYGKYLAPVDPGANIAADSPFWTAPD